MRKMYSENQVKRKALEALNVEKVEDENYSLEFNDPIKFNENVYDKNGNVIPPIEVVEELPTSPVDGTIYFVREV